MPTMLLSHTVKRYAFQLAIRDNCLCFLPPAPIGDRRRWIQFLLWSTLSLSSPWLWMCLWQVRYRIQLTDGLIIETRFGQEQVVGPLQACRFVWVRARRLSQVEQPGYLLQIHLGAIHLHPPHQQGILYVHTKREVKTVDTLMRSLKILCKG
ncbi:MAG: hypothetical protein AAF399_05465 [Bacteroidota bacterium]